MNATTIPITNPRAARITTPARPPSAMPASPERCACWALPHRMSPAYTGRRRAAGSICACRRASWLTARRCRRRSPGLKTRAHAPGRAADHYRPYEAQAQATDLPPVEIIDMREELKAGNRSIFSRQPAIGAGAGAGAGPAGHPVPEPARHAPPMSSAGTAGIP